MYIAATSGFDARLCGHDRCAFKPAGGHTPFGVLPPPADIPDDARARELFLPSTFPLTMIFYLRALSGSPVPEKETNDEVPLTSAAFQRLRGRVTGSATAKPDSFAITVNGSGTIGVIVAVDLERGVPV
jgi:hypothetical protein